MPASYLFPLISACWERNEILYAVILISPCTQTDFGGIFKIIQVYKRYDGANKMQIEQLNNTELFLKLFHIQCKEIGKQQNLKNGKVRFRLNIDVI